MLFRSAHGSVAAKKKKKAVQGRWKRREGGGKEEDEKEEEGGGARMLNYGCEDGVEREGFLCRLRSPHRRV